MPLKKLISSCILILNCLVFSSNSFAQTEVVRISMDQALSKMYSVYYDINLLDKTIQQLDEFKTVKVAKMLPSLDASGRFVYQQSKMSSKLPPLSYEYDKNYYRTNASIEIIQPLHFLRLSHEFKQAKFNKQVAEQQLDALYMELKQSLVSLYWKAVVADQIIDIYEKSLSTTSKHKETLEKNFSNRPIRNDIVRINSDIEMRKPYISRAIADRDTAYRLIRFICNIPQDKKLILTTTTIPLFNPISISGSDTLIIKSHPKVEQWRLSESAFSYASKRENMEHLPKLEAFSTASSIDVSDIELLNNSVSDTEDITSGIRFNWPIYTGGRINALALERGIEANKSAVSFHKAEAEVSRDLYTFVDQFNAYLDVYKSEKIAVRLSKEYFELTQKRFFAGQTTAFELNNAEFSFTLLKISRLNTQQKLVAISSSIDTIINHQKKSISWPEILDFKTKSTEL
ncbi:MAG: TolC family protein [Alphaproteobacteria bacterium]|nr:TolC family protein [Alphaproteobacteria bacterium]MBL0717851.1 TolC family protein [Alphaproteobacteria bacterium]